MKVTIIHAHWNNRGDEAALRAFVDELYAKYENADIYVQVLSSIVKQFPYDDKRIHLSNVKFPKRKNKLDYWMAYLTKGRLSIFSNTREFVKLVEGSDLVLHGPGGPSIGDIYYDVEEEYLKRLDLIRRMGIKYAFYAPSMGPFEKKDEKRNALRRRVLENAEFIYLREATSEKFVKDFGIKNKTAVSLDSAFQHYSDEQKYAKQLDEYKELKEFMSRYDRVVGMTTTDLSWHPVHKKNLELKDNIFNSFAQLIEHLDKQNIGVVFIPQLFGIHNDRRYMETFKKDNCFVIDDTHDTYFQQYLISQLYAVIGMRYHSNIFSAKMGTPFISVSYEQKMSGFMNISGLNDYCVPIGELSGDNLVNAFDKLCDNYDDYKSILSVKKEEWSQMAHRTTDAVFEVLGEK
ncbi:colanic acid/amylovoran biosynthesis protein [Pseudobutyrivibrio sp. 49]|uniref:polysaccharide pyruvyl transferase family protein n=1 Tax=Pseudobutyrivibrio sp. 49 TaxID=1855344 RepID=UPI000891D114|nr:polysaccharide pyruvyl transferase family protein [Pseudobutyrivibrio sp. 49]SDI72380.1 colanic acid/amylovoran biosynthesis protein [Pseudobutyrivibrio sp. 49]